jgi:hypothetical protein
LQKAPEFAVIILSQPVLTSLPFGLTYQGKDIVFRFIIEYSSLWYSGPKVIIIDIFLKDDILDCVETYRVKL